MENDDDIYMEPTGSSANMLSKASGKSRHAGAGGRSKKSFNQIESYHANKRRQAKQDQEDAREEAEALKKHQAEMDAYYAPVDKADAKRMTRLESKRLKEAEKASKIKDKMEVDE